MRIWVGWYKFLMRLFSFRGTLIGGERIERVVSSPWTLWTMEKENVFKSPKKLFSVHFKISNIISVLCYLLRTSNVQFLLLVINYNINNTASSRQTNPLELTSLEFISQLVKSSHIVTRFNFIILLNKIILLFRRRRKHEIQRTLGTSNIFLICFLIPFSYFWTWKWQGDVGMW